ARWRTRLQSLHAGHARDAADDVGAFARPQQRRWEKDRLPRVKAGIEPDAVKDDALVEAHIRADMRAAPDDRTTNVGRRGDRCAVFDDGLVTGARESQRRASIVVRRADVDERQIYAMRANVPVARN